MVLQKKQTKKPPFLRKTVIFAELGYLFPTPQKLARARLNDMGLVTSRADTIRRIARATVNGEISFDTAQDPGELWALPDELQKVALTERSGASRSLADLAGTPYACAFVFTRCGGPCPRITADMAWLQRELDRGLLHGRHDVLDRVT